FTARGIAVGCAKIYLAVSLFTVYHVVYARTKAAFRLALLLFALAFLAQIVLMVYSLITMMALVPSALDLSLLGVGTLEGVGLGAMLWTATREVIWRVGASGRLTQRTLVFADRPLSVGGG